MMNNKMFLKQILDRVDGEYPNSAMVYGTNGVEDNPAYVFVLLDDDFMYFGNQVEGTDILRIKKLDVDKISKVSFLGNNLMIQVKDKTYEFTIVTELEALRAICKEFKMIKTREATKPGGGIMEMDLEESQLGAEDYSQLRTDLSPYGVQDKKEVALQPVKEASKPSYVEQLANFADLMQGEIPEPTKVLSLKEILNEEHKDEIKEESKLEPVVEKMVDPVLDKAPETKRDFLSAMLADVRDSELDEQVTLEAEPVPQVVKEKETQIYFNVSPEQEEPVTEPVIAQRVDMNKNTKEVVRENEKPLTNKEKKMLEKQRKKAEKEERDLYKPAHPIRNAILIVLAVMVAYILGSYALAQSEIITLPLSNLFETMLDYLVVLVSNAKA